MSAEHLAILVAVIAAFGGSGGLVAWTKHRAEAKLSVQRLELERFNTTLAGFQALLDSEKQNRKDLEKRMCTMETRLDRSETYVTVLIDHINAGKPPPPPPRP